MRYVVLDCNVPKQCRKAEKDKKRKRGVGDEDEDNDNDKSFSDDDNDDSEVEDDDDTASSDPDYESQATHRVNNVLELLTTPLEIVVEPTTVIDCIMSQHFFLERLFVNNRAQQNKTYQRRCYALLAALLHKGQQDISVVKYMYEHHQKLIYYLTGHAAIGNRRAAFIVKKYFPTQWKTRNMVLRDVFTRPTNK